MSYTNILKEMGITESRTQDITDAMKALHKAICRLDMQQRRVFSRQSLETHLSQYAKAEQLVDVAGLMYEGQLAESMRRIDFDEFGSFAERFLPLIEDAVDVKLPGASTLFEAVSDLYKVHPRSRLPLTRRVINRALAHAQVHGPIDYNELRIRLSNKYVGEYRHLDAWKQVGVVKTLISKPKGEETIDSYNRTLVVSVSLFDSTNMADECVYRAIQDTYASTGCACEHDCCGCVSSHVRAIRYLGQLDDEGFFVVKMSYTRNI